MRAWAIVQYYFSPISSLKISRLVGRLHEGLSVRSEGSKVEVGLDWAADGS